MKKKKILVLGALAFMTASVVGCKSNNDNGGNKTKYDNDVNPLVMSTQDLDGVFNPFFSTSGTDSNIVGMTQIGMLGNDKDGKPVCGDNEPVVVKDYEITTEGSGENQISTYRFVLKNNVKFSNGSLLTIKDVLFNLYVYLDPLYTGSSTIYSTDIVGLKEYRTQKASENEQDSFEKQFQITATQRIDDLKAASEEIFDDLNNQEVSVDEFKEKLESKSTSQMYQHVVEDFEKAVELFKEELNSDYSSAIDSYQDINFRDDNNVLHENIFTTDVEAFLYNENYITFNKKDGTIECALTSDYKDVRSWTKEEAINKVLEDKMPYDIDEITTYWQTATNLNDYLVTQAKGEYLKNTERLFPNISGITFANKDKSVSVKNKTYGKAEYNSDGTIKDNNNEVLEIKIHKVDPKAIWNFGFAVAPMYYYSNAEEVAKFNFEDRFGIDYKDPNFLTNVVKSPSKIGVPVGAGPYVASKSSGGTDNVSSGDFLDKNVIYFERNENYLMGAPKIKKLRFKVVSQSNMTNALYSKDVDFVEPNAKPETIKELNSHKKDGISNKSVKTSGYGYIGLNAGKIPDIKVRQIIMHSINTLEAVNYYEGSAEAIYRPMSTASWAYPKGATSYYPYIGGTIPEDLSVVNPDYRDYIEKIGRHSGEKLSESEQSGFIKYLVEDLAGYSLNSQGVYNKGNNTLKYKFTIAGEVTDHPAWQALYHAAEILNKNGFQIDVANDANALKKLSEGSLTVWAAAWGSTIDPDMYQVYHKDSKATSVLNWGYKQILANSSKYEIEYGIIDELSTLIDQGRETTDQERRIAIYEVALNKIMELAVELPTYQRDDLFAYNSSKIDSSTFNQDPTPYSGLTDKFWNISLKVS